MSADKKLAHIVLQTTQLPEMKEWYLAVLDADLVFENPMFAFLTFDDEHHRLAIAQIPGLVERTPMTVGLAHSAYTFNTLGDLLNQYEQLTKHGIEPQAPVQHGVTTSIYYRDPGGNMVELQIDNFATADEATAYMQAEEYTTDPIGPTFDPAAMLAALRAGTPEAELITRAWAATTPQRNVLELMMS
jgi:catechol-2,3-dioxygenase